MPANLASMKEWGDEPTVNLPAYRVFILANGDGPMVHVTPIGAHICDLDCDGMCLACGLPLEALS